MPLIQPSTGDTLAIEDRLRTLLADEASLAGLYSGSIRDYPPDGIETDDEVVVAIYTADEDYRPETLGTVRTQPRIILAVYVAEPQQNPDISAIRRRMVNLTTAFREAIWKYRTDPTPGDCKWYALRFRQDPATTSYERQPQRYQCSHTQFEARKEKGNP